MDLHTSAGLCYTDCHNTLMWGNGEVTEIHNENDLVRGPRFSLCVGMFGMRKFRYRYTGKNTPVIPVFGPCKKLSFIGSSES